MNKKLVFIIIIALVIIGIGFYIYNPVKLIDLRHEDRYINQTVPTTDWKTYTRNNMYEFSYPAYGKIKETNSVITNTTVVLTDDWMNAFDVTTHPEEVFCKSNPYGNTKNIVQEDIVTKYGNRYRHLRNEDSSNLTKIITENRYYIFKNNTCYMIVLHSSEKSSSSITTDIEKIFSTFKFAN